MCFSYRKTPFSASADITQEAAPDSPPLPPSTGSTSSSAPLSGDSSACRRRMSKPVFDHHTVCVLCRGFDCNADSHCDECMQWSTEEMEACEKHRQLLLRKDRRRKDSLPKPSSSPVTSPSPSQPFSLSASGVDDHIDTKLAVLSTSFDQKLESLTSILLNKISLLQDPSEHHMSARMSNPSSAASPAVPVLCPSPGLDLPPPNPESTVGLHREFLGEGVGPVPSGSRVPFPLDQGYVRDSGSAMSADAQVPLVVVEASTLAPPFASRGSSAS